MYADQITTGRKRSVHDRLDADLAAAAGWSRQGPAAKRQRQSDDKWKHDLYREDEEPQVSRSMDPRDLRLKLQKKSSQHANVGGRSSGARDLREQLSGVMHPKPTNVEPPRLKPASAKLTKYKSAIERPVPVMKKVPKPSSSKKASSSQQKGELSVDSFLRSIGQEKYSINFQAEEVDMAVLRHMTDEDLKAMGIPMGPRKKILLELGSQYIMKARDHQSHLGV